MSTVALQLHSEAITCIVGLLSTLSIIRVFLFDPCKQRHDKRDLIMYTHDSSLLWMLETCLFLHYNVNLLYTMATLPCWSERCCRKPVSGCPPYTFDFCPYHANAAIDLISPGFILRTKTKLASSRLQLIRGSSQWLNFLDRQSQHNKWATSLDWPTLYDITVNTVHRILSKCR